VSRGEELDHTRLRIGSPGGPRGFSYWAGRAILATPIRAVAPSPTMLQPKRGRSTDEPLLLTETPLVQILNAEPAGVSGTSRDWRSHSCRTYSGRRALPFRTSPRPWPPFLQGTRPAQMRRHGCVPSRLEGRRCSRHCRAMTPVDSASSPRHSVSQPACHIARESPGLLLPWR